MRVCVIGSSGHVNYVLQGLQAADTDDMLAGIAPGSPGEDVATFHRQCRSAGHEPRVFDDYSKMLDDVEPDVAAVACHFGDHAAVATEVLERGIHLFQEKPMATELADLATLHETWKQSGVRLAAMHGLRCTPAFQAAWQCVHAGSAGDIRLATAQKSYRLRKRPDFFRSRDSYGGTIPWVGSHAIDWLIWFIGRAPVSVYAAHSTRNNRGHGDLEVSALCHFTFPDDIFGGVNIDYLRPDSAPTHGDDRLRIAGTKGIVEVRDDKAWFLEDNGAPPEELEREPAIPIFADFLDAVSNERDCLVSAEDSFRVTEACLRARQSADERRVVEF